MTVARRAADVSVRARFRRVVENLLPWFDPVVERERREYIVRLAAREKVASSRAAVVREAYRRASDRLER